MTWKIAMSLRKELPIFKWAATGLVLASTLLFLCLSPSDATDEAALWQAIRSGEAFAIMRHELAPGTGDPQEVKIGDCSTQRNLNDEGRQQAAATGTRFRQNGIDSAEVFTSQWCRCRETAKLLDIGTIQDLPALNSFYENYKQRAPQTKQMRTWLAEHKPGKPLVLVSHQVNIRALTGESTYSGQIVVARLGSNGEIKVLGKL